MAFAEESAVNSRIEVFVSVFDGVGRHAGNYAVRCDILGHYSSRCDYRAATDLHSRKNHSMRSYPHVISYNDGRFLQSLGHNWVLRVIECVVRRIYSCMGTDSHLIAYRQAAAAVQVAKSTYGAITPEYDPSRPRRQHREIAHCTPIPKYNWIRATKASRPIHTTIGTKPDSRVLEPCFRLC